MDLFQDGSKEMWYYRRLLKVPWTEKKTNKEIIQVSDVGERLLQQLMKRKLRAFRCPFFFSAAFYGAHPLCVPEPPPSPPPPPPPPQQQQQQQQ
ncbi:hypothetical protein ElyMa_001924700 [Elysia marginata]|uniref:Uncharacterized protein n=1 Tax=Elysia marginata TaxID=1093978 RepID=A0AAV4EU70_9GAST|nr:hypothetical protein ElyMa_001924700 [Elysia marginata]